MLNGDGGDECFGGYRAVRRDGADPAGSRCPPLMRPRLERLGALLTSRGAPQSPPWKAGRVLELLGHPLPRRYARMMSYFGPEQKFALYSDALRERARRRGQLRAHGRGVRRVAGRTPASVALIDVDVNTYLPGDLLVKSDITTMANSLEARSPFLDHHLMEWAAGLPADLKVRGGHDEVPAEAGGRADGCRPNWSTGRRWGSGCRWRPGCAPSCASCPTTC